MKSFVIGLLFLISFNAHALQVHTTTIQYGYTHPHNWGFMDAFSIGLDVPSSIVATEKTVAKAIESLDKTKKYSCQFEWSFESSIPTPYGAYVPVFTMKKCQEVP